MKKMSGVLAVSVLLIVAACERPATDEPPLGDTPEATAEPSPTPTPTATATPSPTATVVVVDVVAPSPTAEPPVTVPADFATHQDQAFGFSIQYPPEWEAQESTVPPRLLTLAGPEDGQPEVILFLFYQAGMVAADAAVDGLVPDLLDRTAFRTLEEREVTLLDGTPAFQVSYQWRSERGTMRGILFGVARGSQSFILRVEGTEDEVTQNQEDIQALLLSFQMEEAEPLGIPRSDALTMYFDDGPITLDPAIAQESGSIRYIMHIFSGLVSFDADLALREELVSGWEMSAGGTVFTFTLREDAKFHDGRAVTAEDVKFSWERAVSPAMLSQTAGTYLNDIVGVAEVVAGTAEEISGLEVLDSRTLRVTIDAPKAYFLSKLAHPVAFVVDQTEVDSSTEAGEQWWVEPNGTGPFRLRLWENQAFMVLDANEDFYTTPPAIPHVVYRLYGGIPRLMYEAGEIDVATIFADELSEVQGPDSLISGELRVTPQLSITYVGLGSSIPPFDDPLVRKAFLLAVDRDKLVQQQWRGSRDVAQGFLPPGIPGYDPDIPSIAFDPEEAQRLLSESSYGGAEGLPQIVYTTSGFTTPGPIVESLVQMWRENLGVEVTVDGDEVVLRPGSRVPSDMIPPLRQAKAEILALLTHVPDYSITACTCAQPVGGTGPERCGACQLPLLCPNCPGCRGCKLAVKFGRA
ncbi:MAG: ABC transporter substrate-binding protein [Chloroflexi bacterium]|nr:ABC transporter substrate-binding protein [Chloroflexota bacterium]